MYVGVYVFVVHADFGEITLWVGVLLVACNSFTRPAQWLGLLSPIFVAFLLINVSGIPLLEKAADEKWGGEKDYQVYKQTVPVLIPFIGRRGNAKF
jgi:steroid 5-alpha reductase family enzyme